MKIVILILTVLTANFTLGQEYGTWQSSPPVDMAVFQSNLAAPPVSLSGGNSISNPPAQGLKVSDGAQQGLSGSGNDADTITPEIQALAGSLSNNALNILRYVTHNIEFEAYYGCKRGAALTLLEKCGNAHDQCALLVSLLRAAGYEANYIIGPSTFDYPTLQDMLGFPEVPLPEQSDAQILALYGGSLPPGFSYIQARQQLNTFNFLSPRGYPIVAYVDGETQVFDHVWVEVIVGTQNYLLNPSVKETYAAQPIDILANSGYTTAAFLGAAGGTPGTGSIGTASINTINETAINTQLTALTTTFSSWMRDIHPNISSLNLLGKRSIFPKNIPNLETASPNTTINTQWATVMRHSAMPQSEMSHFELRMGDYDYVTKSYNGMPHTETILMPSLRGQKLSLTFLANNATFKLDETVLHTESLPSGRDRIDMDITAVHNHFLWEWNGSAYIKNSIGRNNGFSNTQKYLKNDDYAYVIPYGFAPSGELLRQRQSILDGYLREGLTNSSDEVRTEVLNIMGLTWMHETKLADDLVVAHEDVDLAFLHRVGRVAQEESYYIDFLMQYYSAQSRSTRSNNFVTLPTSQLFHSAYEHAVVEHLQAGNTGSASTIKLIHLANQAGTNLYRVNSANWQTGANIRNLVAGYSASALQLIDDTVNAAGGDVMLPQNGTIQLGDWEGAGFILRKTGFVTMGISGGFSGGYNTVTGQVDFAPLVNQGRSDPSYWENGSSTQNVGYTPSFLERYLGADPVDMATGAFVMERSELGLGQVLPRGLELTRYFNSNRRYDTSPGLGGGWIYNLYGKAIERTSTKGSLGLTSARHVIPTLIAAAVTRDLIGSDSGSAKDLAVAALVAQWASEQITDNAVGIALGDKTMEFVRMPNGTYEGPPGSTLSLVKNGLNKFELTERNASTMVFGTDGWIESVTDQHGNLTAFAYSGEKLSTVTDAYGRTLTFTWTDDQITKVTDSTSREVEFGYSVAGDLTTVTDVEGKAWTYTHTADHQIEAVIDPQSRIITENTYDPLGRVCEQKSMGDANKIWRISYTGSETYEEDPEGNITTYYFDKGGRGIGSRDQLGHYETKIYDGEDQTIITLNKNLETAFFDFDVDHNLTSTTDEAGHTTNYYYDAKDRLERVRDKEGNDMNFTYTATNLLETTKDQLGHVINYGYYPDGLIHTVKDSENKTTTTEYDEWGNVNKITSHDNTLESFVSNARGDLLTSTDAEGRIFTNTWNKRRQLLTTTLPAIPLQGAAVVENTYDDSGNLASVEDTSGNVTSYAWNALGKPASSTLPVLVAGNNVVATTYDSRDWIESTTNSLGHTMHREYDLAHRMTAVIDPLNRRSETTYDAKGQPLEVTDALNRVVGSEWTPRGEMEQAKDGEGATSDYGFDKNGNQTSFVNRRGKTYTQIYDDANRLISSTTPTGKITEMTYFDNNLIETIKEPSGQTTTLAYNGKNLVSSKVDPKGTVEYEYDDSGLLETATEGLDVITRSYDERGKIKTYTNSDGDQLQYLYNGKGNIARLTYPDGKKVNYTYNSRNLLETVTDWSNRLTRYHYDRLGRLIGVTRPNKTSGAVERDAADQITGIRESETVNGKLFSYLRLDHDVVGQIKSRFRAPLVRSNFVHPTLTGTYDDDNRLASVNGQAVVQDSDSNMTFGPIREDSGGLTLTYNSRNQLTNANGLSYTYDAEGHRRTLTDSSGVTRFTTDANANISRTLVKHAPDGSKTYYVYGIGLLYEVDELENTKTHHYDQVGSTIARTDDNGKVIGRAEYSAYGLLALKEGDMETPFLYNGQWGIQTDANGLLNMRARYYSPYLMRFLNADPVGFSGGSNWFAYADGNPISVLDPFGLWGWGNSISLALDFIPIVGTIKGAVELAAGYDFIAGEEVNRGVAAAGLVAGLIPGGKAALKGGTKVFAATIRHADEAADIGKAVVKNGDGFVYKRISTQGEEYFGQAMDGVNYARRQYTHNKTPGLAGPHQFETAGRASPGMDLDILEETFIRNGGGTVREGSSLLNKNHVMNAESYVNGVSQRLREYQTKMLLQSGFLNGGVQSLNRAK